MEIARNRADQWPRPDPAAVPPRTARRVGLSNTQRVSEEKPSMSAPTRTRQPGDRPRGAVKKPRSAYPAPVEELLPKARELATRLGELPSRNRLKAELRIGGPKATAVRERLERSGFDPTGRQGAARLH